ncbi:MAG TPA: thiamine pyrophosphate-dependent enzyme, partial [Rhabdochlamydiaceae bacterium]
MIPFSTASFSNLPLMEALYQQYLQDPASVDASWRAFFDGFEFGGKIGGGEASPELKVYALIEGYRTYGHLLADFNPLATKKVSEVPELELKHFGFSAKDLGQIVPTCGFLKEKECPLQTLIDALKKTYCNRIGIEYMGLGNPTMEAWIQKKIEPYFDLPLSKDEKLIVLDSVNKAELFESFLHIKYVGQKRFSLEGTETLIPALSAIVEAGPQLGVNEIFLGMAHRGRLNVLANIMGKSYGQIFNEFEAHYEPNVEEGSGDVKYHKGFSGTVTTRSSKTMNIVLTPNPSHLEAVDPVVEGQARAEQMRKSPKEVLPILIHGDAALAGQGVIYETLQLCRLHGYSTGGTLHIVINNQIGFTTVPQDSRSTLYCTDVAKGFGAPVFHVNAE